MKHQHHGGVTYRALQKLLERALDQNDTERVTFLSRAIDEASVRVIMDEASVAEEARDGVYDAEM